jgi:pimeloyl-ACP methyl ester carboxylesterase
MGAIGVERADVLGHSMGGGTALTLAARHPERVERLIVVDGALYRMPSLPLPVQLALVQGVGPLLFRHVYGRRDFARGCRTIAVRDGRCLDEEWIDYFWARACRDGGKDAAYACLRMLTSLPEHNADPGRVRAPTLLIWGDEDRMIPLAHGRRLARAVAGARLEVVPASGHMPFIERPEEFLRVLRPFLARPAEPLAETPIPPRRAHSVA